MPVTTDPTPGTMVKAEGQAQAPPAAVAGTPAAGQVSAQEEPKVYTEKQMQTLLHAKDSESGRKIKTLETERDSWKSKHDSIQSEIQDNTTDIEKLEAKLEAMAQDDPAKFDVIKELKEARTERRQLKKDREALEAEKQVHAEDIKLAKDTLFEIRTWDIAQEYEGGNAVMLKNLCDSLEATTEEKIRKAADSIWTKKAAGTTEPPKAPVVLSGQTSGGTGERYTQAEVQKMTPKQITELKKKHGVDSLLELIVKGVIIQK